MRQVAPLALTTAGFVLGALVAAFVVLLYVVATRHAVEVSATPDIARQIEAWAAAK